MKQVRRILVFAGTEDGGEVALREAIELASRVGADVLVYDVVRPVPGAMKILASVDEALAFEAELADERHRELEGVCDRVAVGTDVPCTVEIGIGKPSVEIVRTVLRRGVDLVVKTAGGGGRFRKRLFGSVGTFLMRNCPCPVWIVRPGAERGFHRVVAAVDLEETTSTGRALNERIVEFASSLAAAESAELHVVHAWHVWIHVDIPEIARQQELACSKEMARILARHDVSDATPHVIEGQPEEVVPDLVHEVGADLLVMGTVCRTGLAGFLIGNTAERIVNDVDVSLLTVKPDGFVTPVTLDDEAPSRSADDGNVIPSRSPEGR